jgi:hypothetical protein
MTETMKIRSNKICFGHLFIWDLEFGYWNLIYLIEGDFKCSVLVL